MLNHVEDETSQLPWNTPFKVKVNFKGTAVDATLDTAASLSVMRAELIPDLSSPLVLGMDFMIRTSLTINIPTRTVITGDNTPCLHELDDVNSLEASDLVGGSMMFLEVPPSALHDKVEEANLERGEKAA